MTRAAGDDVQRRLRSVRRPAAVLPRERERALTDRQRELLDQLQALFADGFAHLTMAELAARLNCSLRTLYALAPSRDELVLIVVDRNLWRVGRTARDAIAPDLAPLEAVRAYLGAATVAVSRTTATFSRDLGALPRARQLATAHSDYLFAVTRTLLDLAVEQGQIAAVDTAAVGRILAGLGQALTHPDIIPTLQSTPKEAADTVVDLIISGLQAAVLEGAR